VRELASHFLKAAGYTVLSAKSGGDALESAKRWGKPIHVLLTDVVMAHMRGPELASLLRRVYPGIKTVYMSGYQDYGARDGGFEEGCLFVQKPFSRDHLLDVIVQALKPGPVEQGQPLSMVEAAVPMKARRRPARRSRRPMAV
jgi:two-component system, cell cycle sensor histidine kinase and response regulator CckA